MVIAHELHALDLVERGFKRKALYYLLLSRSRLFAKGTPEWSGYKYAVPGQFKGEYETLRVIGDKKGGSSIVLLGRHPELLDCLMETVSVEVKIIHVTRNPLDNIPTMAAKNLGDQSYLDEAIEKYFSMCDIAEKICSRVSNSNWINVSLEKFIYRPEKNIKTLCKKLGLNCSEKYLKDCSSVVFDSPSRTRNTVSWSKEKIDNIRNRTHQYDLLPYGRTELQIDSLNREENGVQEL